MRNIKFRAWNEVKKKMEFDVYKEYKNLMQYTGLKDKNGVDIYEGDIVNGLANHPNELYVRTVVWKNCGLTLEPGTGYTLTKGNEDCFEVIGNIYESPELLRWYE